MQPKVYFLSHQPHVPCDLPIIVCAIFSFRPSRKELKLNVIGKLVYVVCEFLKLP